MTGLLKLPKWQIAVGLVLAVSGLLGLLTEAVLPHLAWLAEGETRWWMRRAGPTVNLPAGAIAAVVAAALLPRQQRHWVAAAGVGATLAWAGYYGVREVVRLSAYSADYPAWRLAGYVDGMVWVGAAIAAAAIVTLVGLIYRPSAAAAERRNPFGDIRWMTMKEAAELLPPDGDIVVGECYRVDEDRVAGVAFKPGDKTTWGRGGSVSLLTFKSDFDSGHTIFVAGSGGFKTTSTVVPTALRYQGSMVVLDPSAEVGGMVAPQRAKMGRKVVFLDPTLPPGKVKGFDVLAPVKSPEDGAGKVIGVPNFAGIAAFAQMLMPEAAKADAGSAEFFKAQAHNLLTGIIVFVLWSGKYAGGPRSLREVRELASKPEKELKAFIGDQVEDKRTPLYLKQTWGAFVSMADQTWTGVASSVAKDTQWLSLPEYEALVCGDAFSASDLPEGELDVFLQIPGAMLKTYSGVGRVILGSLMQAMVAADGKHKRRVLYCLDEVDLLGYMNILEEARDRGRKYGISVMLLYQSIGQIEKHFGKEGATSWFESVSFVSYAAVKGMDTAEAVSAQCGEKTVMVRNESRPAGLKGWFGDATVSVSPQKRALILPSEITRTMRADEQIIIVRGKPPLRCGRAIFFRRPEMLVVLSKAKFGGKQAAGKVA